MSRNRPKGIKRGKGPRLESELTAGQQAQQRVDSLIGTGEAALTIGSGIIAEPLAGLAGIASLPAGVDQSVENISKVRDYFTYTPSGEAGKEKLQAVGESLAPVGEFLESGSRYLGDKTLEYTDSPALAAAAHSAPTLFAELLGLKGVRAASKTGKLGKQYSVNDINAKGPGKKQAGAVSRIKAAADEYDKDLSWERQSRTANRPELEPDAFPDLIEDYNNDRGLDSRRLHVGNRKPAPGELPNPERGSGHESPVKIFNAYKISVDDGSGVPGLSRSTGRTPKDLGMDTEAYHGSIMKNRTSDGKSPNLFTDVDFDKLNEKGGPWDRLGMHVGTPTAANARSGINQEYLSRFLYGKGKEKKVGEGWMKHEIYKETKDQYPGQMYGDVDDLIDVKNTDPAIIEKIINKYSTESSSSIPLTFNSSGKMLVDGKIGSEEQIQKFLWKLQRNSNLQVDAYEKANNIVFNHKQFRDKSTEISKKALQGRGINVIPYINDVEDAGSVSVIILDPNNIKSRLKHQTKDTLKTSALTAAGVGLGGALMSGEEDNGT